MAGSAFDGYTFHGYRPADAMDESLLRKYIPDFDRLREQNFSLQDGEWFLRPGATDPFAQYTFGSAENGANKVLALKDKDGKLLGTDQYYYDEPSMGKKLVEGAAMIGGSAMGINALFNPAGAMGAFGATVPTGAEAGLSGFEPLGEVGAVDPISLGEVWGPAEQITVTGTKLPAAASLSTPAAIGAGVAGGALIGSSAGGDPTNYSNEGRNYPTPESTQGAGGSPVNASTTGSGIGGGIADFFAANPKLALSLLGSIGGKLFGGSGGSGGTGGSGGNQSNLIANSQPMFNTNRQYNAPPSTYRPGFDPEWKYFTGIGAVGANPPAQPTPSQTEP